MTASTVEEVQALKEIGRIVATTVQEMKQSARVGMTTLELDEIGGQVLSRYGAVSAPKVTYQFPGYTCISLNHDVAHGIPGSRKIKAGDLINIDVSAQLNGFYADTGHSFQMPPYDPALTRLCRYTHDTMMKVIHSLTHGVRVSEIGRLIEQEAANGGYKVIRNLCSHGIGRALHEPPTEILPVFSKHEKRLLREGLVLTIEPFLSTGAEHVATQKDGWTLSVPDRSYVAQHEHTIMITRGKPVIFTMV
ncbi:type I methionyl aminopeptidase [Paenibacillus koleovorans]|uniref:type I methionyl aminopeptidase n=1 Tax=Paenibacillus koleovorans TaxID=121608 RepID=UPI000FDA9CEB|nr:type I methionyl aminopeptidase [Paenibacillus koleovorans]